MGTTDDEPDVHITFRIRPDVHRALGEYAQHSERSMNRTVNFLLAEALQAAGLLPDPNHPHPGGTR